MNHVQTGIKIGREDDGSIFGLKNPLRKCTRCGLEAWTEKDLHKFKRNRNYLFGRANICKICDSKDRLKYYDKHKEKLPKNMRQRELIESFPKPLTCSFCGKLITKLTGCDKDSLAIHSIDGDHENWDPANKAPYHVGCHQRFHRAREDIACVKESLNVFALEAG